MTNDIAMGATIWFAWKNVEDVPLEQAYVSFGGYNEQEGTDGYGVPDELVFMYCQYGEEQLKAYMDNSTGLDFDILRYEVRYIEKTIEEIIP